jgi:hypothetical protein
VWTGREVIVWGGRSDTAGGVTTPASPGPPDHTLDNGAAYDVGRDRWHVLSRAPIAGRYDPVAVWTGSEMLVVGGRRDRAGASFVHDGAAYDPVRDRWHRIPEAPGCPSFGAWTGRELVVGGTCADTAGARPTFASYDTVRRQWTTLPGTPATQLVAAAGRVFAWNSATGRGAVLDTTARAWSPLPPLPGVQRTDSLAGALGAQLAVTGLLQQGSFTRDHATVDVLGLESGRWRHHESTEVTPAMEGSVVAGSGDTLLWSGGAGYSCIRRSGTAGLEWSSADKSVELGATGQAGDTGQSILSIGERRFFIWGGRVAGTAAEPTNYPTAYGAILRVP